VVSGLFPACYSLPATYTGGVADDTYWPGKKFGLPPEGKRSTPTYLRRVLGLAIDWGIAVAVSIVFFDYNGLWTLAIFILLQMLGGLLLAGSPGHLLTGMRIAPIRGGALGIFPPLIRPLLVALVIPAVMVDEDQRGIHDRLVGTILVRR
jgi:uncharacterized RDD family membrane protein YckC